jgi:hypothetical protein
MRQVISYIRVSTGKQGKSGLGIEAQREAMARFIAAEGCEALGEFVEVETGKGADAPDRRPAGACVLARAVHRLGRRHLRIVRDQCEFVLCPPGAGARRHCKARLEVIKQRTTRKSAGSKSSNLFDQFDPVHQGRRNERRYSCKLG